MRAVVIAEAIRTAQELAGTPAINAEQLRDGFEALEITPERLEEIGLPDFGPEIEMSCRTTAAAAWSACSNGTPRRGSGP